MKTTVACVAVLVALGMFAEMSGAAMRTDAECHRLRTKVEKVRPYCVYLCHMPEGYIKMGMEEDGTPCRFFVHEGVCQNGLCLLDKPRKDRPTKDEGGEGKEGGAVTPKVEENAK